MAYGDFNGEPPRIAVKDGRFEIPGRDPEKPNTFYFLDLNDRLGATVELSGKSARMPVTVQSGPRRRSTSPEGERRKAARQQRAQLACTT